MSVVSRDPTVTRSIHAWLRNVRVAFVPGRTSPLHDEVANGLLRRFEFRGHQVQEEVNDNTDILLTTARFGEAVPWRESLFFTCRRKYGLTRAPTIFTLICLSEEELRRALEHFHAALRKDPTDPEDFSFPGLAPTAYSVLLEQGLRGGPILALERLVQAQAMSIQAILAIYNEGLDSAYIFDLVGSHPRIAADDLDDFYDDILFRMVTAVSTSEVNEHEVVGDFISQATWRSLSSPAAMQEASKQLGERNFFTDMIRIADLVEVPAISEAVASQYSEGCFATWDPTLGALIATVTGSARPVDKGAIGDDDLAVIVGVRPDQKGAQVRHVEGKGNDPPSSEAVEMIDMDAGLPRITLQLETGEPSDVPVIRSKLHGHRGVDAYDPEYVEHVHLDLPYYHLPVSCGTYAQAQAIKAAFLRSEALQHPEDPRQIVFAILPGHGVVIAEKWIPGKAPFEAIWEAMDDRSLEVANLLPQGPFRYEAEPSGRMVLKEA
jgi:hypothetical protein